MAALVAPFANVNGYRFEAVLNLPKNKDGSDKTILDHLNDYQGKGPGLYRGFKLLEGITKLVVLYLKDVGSIYAEFGQELAGKLGTVANGLSVFRLQDVSTNAIRSIRDWSKPSLASIAGPNRDRLQKIHDIGEGAATWGFVASFFTGSAFWANLAAGPDALANVTDLTMFGNDWLQAKTSLEHVNEHDPENAPVQLMLKEKVTHAFFMMLKAVCSVATGVLGLMVLGFGGPVLPPLPLVALGLTGTISAIAAHFFKETATYKIPEFPEIRQVQVLAPGAAG